MPFYNYSCPHCSHKEEKNVSYTNREEQSCGKCGEKTKYTPSFKFNAHNLPNGFASTRSKSRREE